MKKTNKRDVHVMSVSCCLGGQGRSPKLDSMCKSSSKHKGTEEVNFQFARRISHIATTTLQRTNKAILCFSVGSLSQQDPQRLRAIALRVLQYIERGQVSIAITGVLPLSLAGEAHHRIESRRNLGKLLLSGLEGG